MSIYTYKSQNKSYKKDPETKIIFAKGGDRFADNIPEMPVIKEYRIRLVSGLGEKTHNSSDFLSKQ